MRKSPIKFTHLGFNILIFAKYNYHQYFQLNDVKFLCVSYRITRAPVQSVPEPDAIQKSINNIHFNFVNKMIFKMFGYVQGCK